MNEYGELLYKAKTDSLKNGLVFTILGILISIGANFMYAKIFGYIFGVIFILIGLFFLIFKRKDGISIYEQAIFLHLNDQLVIKKEDIKEIAYRELNAPKNPVKSYYPILLLKDGQEIFINIAFNKLINKKFEAIIKDYI
ncbi:hypothetical protein [Enterococcus termitis]|uniref:Uncharacterized protein n=1 Tax=Enterococcus termitis TaxID=332950 RepID=A0A1E5G985_9ENTE|nr:hypothetical protein [Enterococcus termitis]OEG09145.1 hypothetical protein BCR25_11280 [Enterococcus termitis]OJG98602.1 hypothetical protein RV18_GL003025 [Enterococcus termitis]